MGSLSSSRIPAGRPVSAGPGETGAPRLEAMVTVPRDVDEVIRRALDEDLGPAGDVTSAAVVARNAAAAGRFEARAEGVLAGLPVAERVFRAVDPGIEV